MVTNNDIDGVAVVGGGLQLLMATLDVFDLWRCWTCWGDNVDGVAVVGGDVHQR